MDHEKWLEQHDRMMADHEIMMVRHKEATAEAIARADREMAALRESQAKTENTLRWAIRLSVREHRNERKRRQELAEAAAKRHQELEDLMKAFLKRGGNGKP